MIATTSTPALVPPPVATLAPAPVMTTLAPPGPALASNATPAVAAVTAPTSSLNNLSASLIYKGLLNQYIQKESLPPAIYKTVNEGSAHLPRFRSTVLVGEEEFSSPNVFFHVKEAEHDAAKIALESLPTKVKEEDFSLIHEELRRTSMIFILKEQVFWLTFFSLFKQFQGIILCKSILHEYAAKMQMEKPVYNTFQTLGNLPSFVSSLVLNGVTYVGKSARTKKEAEQLVAQSVLLAISGGAESTSRTTLSKIVSSKSKFLAALPKNNGIQNAESSTSTMSNAIVPVIATSKPVQSIQPVAAATLEEMKLAFTNVPSNVEQPLSILPHHTFSLPKGEALQGRIELPIAFVPPNYVPSANVGQGSGKRKKKNKKKGTKKMRTQS